MDRILKEQHVGGCFSFFNFEKKTSNIIIHIFWNNKKEILNNVASVNN